MKGVLASTPALFGVAFLALGCGTAKSTKFTQSSTSPGSSNQTEDGGTEDATTFFSGGDDGGLSIGPQPEAGSAVTSVCSAGV